MYVICDLAMHIIITKSQYCDVRDFTLDARIPSMYYIAQPDSYQNTQNYLPDLYLPYNTNTSNAKKTGIVVPVSLNDNFISCRTITLHVIFSHFRQHEKFFGLMIKRQQAQHLQHHQHRPH